MGVSVGLAIRRCDNLQLPPATAARVALRARHEQAATAFQPYSVLLSADTHDIVGLGPAQWEAGAQAEGGQALASWHPYWAVGLQGSSGRPYTKLPLPAHQPAQSVIVANATILVIICRQKETATAASIGRRGATCARAGAAHTGDAMQTAAGEPRSAHLKEPQHKRQGGDCGTHGD